ncbi:GTPase-associated protein 1-related protein [Streptomyces sp. NPDC045251]|uniref:GTPase-associated protein 1-related protein n=1 Tax=unclassified Streptomyces TaxID=2593676 RepID=UPI0033EFC4CD
MTHIQLHYTSAPPGPDGSGFRFTAVGPGAAQGVLREAEQLIGYEPPRDLPSRPDAAQLAGFPRAFSFSELSDGGHLLSRSVYTGADYSGRWGNFHAHALYVPPGEPLPGGALPITAWESPRWADSTPAAGRPEPIDRFDPPGTLSRDALVAFAASRSAWLAPVFASLRDVVDNPDAGQLVLVEHESGDVARWIALACSVLPREQAFRLTFTTYTRRPQQARQQIVGVLPSSEQCPADRRYRVHQCTGRPPSEPVHDAWADVAARVWLAGLPELFRQAGPGLGPLAAAALTAGVDVRADARAAAARWALDHVESLSGTSLTRLVGALSTADDRARPATAAGPTGAVPAVDEQTPLAELFHRLDGRLPTAATSPLAARLLTTGVLGGGPVPDLSAGSLTSHVRATLAQELGAALRSGIADPEEPADGRPLVLLRIADLLDVDCQELLPALAGRLARALVAEANSPDAATAARPRASARARPSAVTDAVREHPALRLALFGALDALAAAEPSVVARQLAGTDLPVELRPDFPNLRMCIRATADDTGVDDRLALFHLTVRTAGVSPHADASVLRTALDLVWPDDLPTAAEASLLLNELGSDTHRAAGTHGLLISAAFAAPEDDPDVPVLATDLLRCFQTELRAGQRPALLLLEYAGLLGTEGEGTDWVSRVLTLRESAVDPVPDAVTERVFTALARRLVRPPVPDGELYALARSAEPRLLAAYERVVRSRRVGDRLRTTPSYVAACFCAWTSCPGAHPAWDEARTALLTTVLRPIVRALPADDLAGVEAALGRTGRGKLDAFRSWNRPSAFGRLAGRLSGRGRRAEPPAVRHGDVEPPAEGGPR